jgi:hypothetical protein
LRTAFPKYHHLQGEGVAVVGGQAWRICRSSVGGCAYVDGYSEAVKYASVVDGNSPNCVITSVTVVAVGSLS